MTIVGDGAFWEAAFVVLVLGVVARIIWSWREPKR